MATGSVVGGIVSVDVEPAPSKCVMTLGFERDRDGAKLRMVKEATHGPHSTRDRTDVTPPLRVRVIEAFPVASITDAKQRAAIFRINQEEMP